MPIDDRALMSIRADTLWTYDARGRMLRSNEPDGQPAPRLFVGRTQAAHVTRFGEAVPRAVARALRAIIERQPTVDALTISPAAQFEIRATLEWRPLEMAEGGGPAYRFPE